MSKRGVRALVSAAVFLGALGVGLLVRQAPAGANFANGCTQLQVTGHYGFLGNGQILNTNELGLPAGPFATSGIINLRYDGTWVATQTATFDGNVSVEQPSSGTWSVSPDCRFAIAGANMADFGRGAVVNKGNEVLFMDASVGVVTNNRLVRLDPQ